LLPVEAKIYRNIAGGSNFNRLSLVGIPTFHYFGVEGEFNVLVTELLGPSLEDLLSFCGNQFSIPTTLILGEQMVLTSFLR